MGKGNKGWCIGTANGGSSVVFRGRQWWTTTGTVDSRVSVGKEFLAKAGYSEGCRFALDRRQERMREWENSGNEWSRHGGRRPERQGK